MDRKKLTIVVGHYGSGKTEFVVNYVSWLQELGENPVLADVDIVNPYFRARELRDIFKKKGIRIISSYFEDDFHADAPALAASIKSCFDDCNQRSVVDVGGDPAGAVVLARYSKMLETRDYDMWFVVNANRPQTATAAQAIVYLREIEAMSKLKVTGIINTTHMLRETTIDDVLKGDALVRELAEVSKVPVVFTVIEKSLSNKIEGIELAGQPFLIELELRPDWCD